MPLYYFHLRDGEDVLLDPEGCELPDLESVGARALLTARSLMSADILEGRLQLDLRIDVEDGGRRLIYRLPFADAIETTPAPTPDCSQG
jgi:hypothetical protein